MWLITKSHLKSMSKINSAESIRGLACIAVILSHISLVFFPVLHNPLINDVPTFAILEWIHNSPFAFLYSGSAAVYVFFVLSGFVLSYACIRDKTRAKQKLFSMAVKRYPRLAIPAIFSSILFWFAFLMPVDTTTVSKWFLDWGTQDKSIFYAAYDGAINSFIFGSPVYNRVLWTMQIELFGSFAVLIILYFSLRSKALFLLSVISFLALSILISTKFFIGMTCFIIGMLIYLYCKPISFKLALPILIIGLYLAGAHNDSSSYNLFISVLGNKTYLFLTAMSGPIIVYSILMNEKISSVLDNPFFVYLGKLSFSMYLLHTGIIYIVGVPLFNLIHDTYGFLLSAFVSAISILIVTFLASMPYSKYIDDLSIKVGRGIEKRISRKAS